MNPLHLIWIIPLAGFLGFLWGISTGMYFGGKRAAKYFAVIWDKEMAKRK